MVTGQVPVVVVFRIIFCQQRSNLVAQYSVQFTGRDILVACYALFYTLNDFQRGLHTYIGGYQHLLQVVEHVVVHLRLTCNSPCQLVEHAALCLLQTFIQRLFLFFIKKSENTHLTSSFLHQTSLYVQVQHKADALRKLRINL